MRSRNIAIVARLAEFLVECVFARILGLKSLTRLSTLDFGAVMPCFLISSLRFLTHQVVDDGPADLLHLIRGELVRVTFRLLLSEHLGEAVTFPE